jgi:hypothetical protein
MTNPQELLQRALAAPPDSAERILFAAAGFNALTDRDLVLVGGAAQATHTGIGRVTDIDLVGYISSSDEDRIRAAGFRRVGRHWVLEHHDNALAIEVPDTELLGEEPPELVDVDGTRVAIIAVTDLMMDRLLQASDRTRVTREEAGQLAVAASDRIDWDQLAERAARVAKSDPFLRDLPSLLDEIHRVSQRHG